jgi:prevent-host-death family protein
MTNKTVSTVEFIRHFGRYHDEAMREPITLTKHGRASVVVLPAELYERMARGAADPRKTYLTHETPPELADMLLSELDKRLAHISDEPQHD